jgi:hypothetical protein
MASKCTVVYHAAMFQARSSRVIFAVAVLAVALCGSVPLFFYALGHPHEIGAIQLVCKGVIAFGIALVAIGVWRREGQGS